MKSSYWMFLLLLGMGNTLLGQLSALEQKLFELPDISFEKIKTPDGFDQAFKLMIKQPLDHNDDSKGYFYQKAYLNHRNLTAPTVIVTEGYNRNHNRIYELTELLSANQIDVEHRFFGESMPDTLEYQYLDLEQVTADLHHINSLLRKIYQNKWISTGISKGGQTTMYYRYFYPEDVDVSVPYVAPLNRSLEDRRIYSFLDTVGTEQCREDIREVQLKILENRDLAMDKLEWYAKGKNLDFSYLTFEEAFEYTVLEYPFSFWQWGGDCGDLPSYEAPLDTILDHFVQISDIGFFADGAMQAYASHYYQAGDEMGYYSYEIDEFGDLIVALKGDENPTAIFMPGKSKFNFDGKLPQQLNDWLHKEGNNFIYINGNADTWSATAFRPQGNTDAIAFFLADKDHGQARIKNMSKKERGLLISKLEDWLGIDITDIFMDK